MAAAAASSLSVLPYAPRGPLQLGRAARQGGGGGGARNAGGGGGLRLARLQSRHAVAAAGGEAELPVELAEETMRVAADDDSLTATVVSALLTVAFVGLSLLTIGVIYLAVQDFLQKREREKFEREEAEKQKEEAKKKRAKARKKRRNY